MSQQSGGPYRKTQSAVDTQGRTYARATANLGWLRAAALVIDYGLALLIWALVAALGFFTLEGIKNWGVIASHPWAAS